MKVHEIFADDGKLRCVNLGRTPIVTRNAPQVEAHARMTVQEIFEDEGEEAFREVETAVLQVRRCQAHAH